MRNHSFCFWQRLVVVSILASSSVATAQNKRTTIVLYVATDGNDAWSGTLNEPNPAKSDGPLASLKRASDRVRELRKTSEGTDLQVQVRGGIYRLDETLVFGLEDSATRNNAISICAFDNESPVISSGVPIHRWKKLETPPPNLPETARGKVWVADVPAELGRVLTLYDGMDRLTRARGPGFSPPAFVSKAGAPSDRINFPAGAIRNWPDLKDAELLVIPTADYEMSILPLATVDEAARVATTTVPSSRPMGKVKFCDPTAWAENVVELLDQPGEWVFRSADRKLYYWPRGERPGENIVAPRLTELVRVDGRVDYDGPADMPVRGLRFQGLTFAHTERFVWHGFTGWSLQHHWEMFDRPTAALRLRAAEGCTVERCRFTALGGTGLRLDLHSQNNRVKGCEIGNIGGVGVLLAGYGPGTKDVNRENEISNNWIHHTGQIYWATPAVMIWQSSHNLVANNLIHNTPYSAVAVSGRIAWSPKIMTSDGSRTVRWKEVGDPQQSLSWDDRERFLHSRGNRVFRNDIHHIMEVMGDGDGVYISGAGGKNAIEQNYIHDSDSDGMADGIRCDDFQEQTIIEGNVIFRNRCIGQGICSKGQNHILNNIIVDMRPSRRPIRVERRTRAFIGLVVNPVTGSKIQRNILVSRTKEYPVYYQNRVYGAGGEPRLRDCLCDNNLYFCTDDPTWGAKHLATEQAFGVETHSLLGDPLFVNLDKGDLRLRPESPAWKLGFRPIDFSSIGLRQGHSFWRAGPGDRVQ